MGSYRCKGDDEPPQGLSNFKGEAHRADTHEREADPDVRLYKKVKGQHAVLYRPFPD